MTHVTFSMLLAAAAALSAGTAFSQTYPSKPIRVIIPAAAGDSCDVLAVHPSVPFKSTRDLIVYAKANPGKLTFGSPAAGSVSSHRRARRRTSLRCSTAK